MYICIGRSLTTLKKLCPLLTTYLGGKYLFFVSSRSVKMRGFSFLSLYKSVFIFQFLNNKMHNYVLFNIFEHFFIQILKNKHTFLKTEKAKFSRRENLVFILYEEIVFFFNFSMIKFTIVFCLP